MFGVLKRKERRRWRRSSSSCNVTSQPHAQGGHQWTDQVRPHQGARRQELENQRRSIAEGELYDAPTTAITITHLFLLLFLLLLLLSGARYHSGCQVCPAFIRRPTRSTEGTSGRLKQKPGVCIEGVVVLMWTHPLSVLSSDCCHTWYHWQSSYCYGIILYQIQQSVYAWSAFYPS